MRFLHITLLHGFSLQITIANSLKVCSILYEAKVINVHTSLLNLLKL